ncbi:beta strand repeat-containing protein [Edaphocola aurantiacus]|uniref:beta strand repeat-containing protein n=1 Tax=Edaphocola aurantiacus TaxID=2601682 RepID=UPI001C949C32|nr:hypothetical protein [Edaphocola aurantiacus]
MKQKTITKITVPVLLLAGSTSLQAQQRVSDGTANAAINPAAVMELQSNNKGFLPSRVALTDRLLWTPMTGSPAKGMVVFNTTTGGANGLDTGLVVWEGKWNPLSFNSSAAAGDFWRLKGNAASTPPATVGTAVGAANFWGTTDAKNLALGVNNITRMIFDQNANAVGGAATSAGSQYSFIWGQNDTVGTGSNHSSVFGLQNKINASTSSFATGYNNALTNSPNSTVSGNSNILFNAGGSAVSGDGNKDSATYTIVAGRNHTIGGNALGTAVFGQNHVLSATSIGQNLVSGSANTLTGDNTWTNVVGGQNNNINTAIASAVFGNANKDSSSYTLVAGGSHSISANADNSVVLGNAHKIAVTGGNANYSTVLGNINTITVTGGNAGANLVGGNYNIINTAADAYSSIIYGSDNRMSNAKNAAIFGGSNKDTSNYTFISGFNNIIGSGSANSGIIGTANQLDSGSTATFISGRNNDVSNSKNTLIAGSRNNITAGNSGAVLGDGNIVNAPGNPFGIVAGQNNELYGTNQTAVFGFGNVDSGGYNLMTGKVNKTGSTTGMSLIIGENNYVMNSPASFTYTGAALGAGFPSDIKVSGSRDLVSGLGNTVGEGFSFKQGNNATIGSYNKVTESNSNLITGYQDTVTGSNFSSLSGFRNTLTSSSGAHIAGASNTLTNANLSNALGSNNTITNAAYSTAIGQNNTVTQNNSMALGTNATTTNSNQLVLGFSNGVVLPKAATAPGSPVEGQAYYDTTLHKLRVWDGTTWQNAW